MMQWQSGRLNFTHKFAILKNVYGANLNNSKALAYGFKVLIRVDQALAIIVTFVCLMLPLKVGHCGCWALFNAFFSAVSRSQATAGLLHQKLSVNKTQQIVKVFNNSGHLFEKNRFCRIDIGAYFQIATRSTSHEQGH